MSKFLICECCNQTYLEEDMSKNNKNMCCSCWCYTRPKDKRIAELEEQLKNAIVPPIKLGSVIYKLVYNANIDEKEIYSYYLDYCDNEKYYTNCETLRNNFRTHYFKDFNKLWFATKEEAQAKLKELKGE